MNNKYFYIIFSVLIWSSMGIFVRLLSISGIATYFFVALISTLFFGILLVKDKNLKKFFTKDFKIPLLIGIFGVINNVSYFYSYKLTTIANATFVHYLAPILILIVSPLILSEKTDRKIWTFAILSLIGLLIILNITTLNLDRNSVFGIILAFVSAIGYAGGVITFKVASKKFDSKEISFSQMFYSVLILLPFIIFLKPTILSSDLMPLLTLGIIHQGIAVLLFIIALKEIPSTKASIITYLEPVGAVLLALLFLNEIPKLNTLIGGIIILVACYLTIYKDKKSLS